MNRIEPGDEKEACEAVKQALADGGKLKISGHGSRGEIGRPVAATALMSSHAMRGITLYEPAEMIIGAKAGTPIAEIDAALAEHGQALTFEPMDHRPMMGTSGEPTIGGLVAGNISGPRRIIAGAARDNVVGVRFVNGRGEAIKNGGRVMKNVTGLDLVRLMCGSWGTLGFLSEVTLKVLPKPPDAATLIFRGLSDTKGVQLLCRAMGTPFEVNGAAHIVTANSATADGGGITALRIEGFEEQIGYRLGELTGLLKAYGEPEVLRGEAHAAHWRSVRDVEALGASADDAIWRISVKPSAAARIVEAIGRKRAVKALYDWSGGLIWLATKEDGNAGEALIRDEVSAFKGHATLIRGSAALRSSVLPFHPTGDALSTIQRGIKASFDPGDLFNPGLMGG